MPRPMITVTLDFASIEARIAKGERVTVRHIAEEKGVSPQIVRRALLDHYSAKVKFTRGRTGGIAISGGTPAATSTSAGPEVAEPAATA